MPKQHTAQVALPNALTLPTPLPTAVPNIKFFVLKIYISKSDLQRGRGQRKKKDPWVHSPAGYNS